ncbi:hypothetical protein PO124_03985 [Bacillus licheniformis]|nr:hypothetical protein [Bacillus licheniformis]
MIFKRIKTWYTFLGYQEGRGIIIEHTFITVMMALVCLLSACTEWNAGVEKHRSPLSAIS